MPLIKNLTHNDSKILIWKIEESEDFFYNDVNIKSNIKNDIKRIEHLTGRFLLKKIFPEINLSHIVVSSTRKPILQCGRLNFSLSHSFPYVAAIIHPSTSVGIDIQTLREKIVNIKHKFLHPSEIKNFTLSTEILTLIWCAKEALYKMININGLEFKSDFLIYSIEKMEDEVGIFNVKATIFPGTLNEKKVTLIGHLYETFAMVFTT